MKAWGAPVELVNGFRGKSARVTMYLLAKAPRKPVSQKEIVEATGLSKGMVSRVMAWLVAKGLVKRPYRTRFILEYPEKLLIEWIGQREIALKKAFFAADESALAGIAHTHTLFSGAWLDSGYLHSGFTTVYVKPGFEPDASMNAIEGKVGELKSKVVLIPAEDEFVFYGRKKIGRNYIVNPCLLYADLASLGGMGLTALEQVAEKHKLPKVFTTG